jgi:hypothetical protein
VVERSETLLAARRASRRGGVGTTAPTGVRLYDVNPGDDQRRHDGLQNRVGLKGAGVSTTSDDVSTGLNESAERSDALS